MEAWLADLADAIHCDNGSEGVGVCMVQGLPTRQVSMQHP